MTGEEALAELRKDPEKFLKKHRLLVTALFDRSSDHKVWLFNDGQDIGNHDSFTIAGDRPSMGHPVELDVYGVQVYNFADVNPGKLPAAQLPPRDGGPGFMATVTLTGCSVVMQRKHSDSGPFVAHIQPDRDHGQNGEELQKALHGAHFDGSTHSTEIYGRHDYPELHATAIALRGDGHWDLYTQSFGLKGGEKKIVKVEHFSLH